MVQKEKLEIVCPDCGWTQFFRPRKGFSERSDDMRTECKRCGRSFKVLDQRKEKVASHRKKEDHSDKPFGFHKYSKKQ